MYEYPSYTTVATRMKRTFMYSFDQEIIEEKTGWIYLLNKTDLCDKLSEVNATFDPTVSIDILRREFVEIFKGIVTDRKNTKEGAPTKMTALLTTIEAFKEGATEEKKVPLLITKLTPSVYEILKTLCTPQTPLQKTYEQLGTLVAEYCQPSKGEAVERYTFRQRKQQQDEKVQQYATELRRLATKCNFANTESEIIEQLLVGLSNNNIRLDILKKENMPSLSEIIRIANAIELGESGAARVVTTEENQANVFAIRAWTNSKNRNTTAPGRQRRVGAGGRPVSTPLDSTQSSGTSSREDSCYCCGKVGHRRASCTLRFKFCSECGTQGHIFRRCPRKQDRESRSTTSDTRQNVLNLVETDTGTEEMKELNINDIVENEDEDGFDSVFSAQDEGQSDHIKPCWVELLINHKRVKMEVDLGSAISVISLQEKNRLFPTVALTDTQRRFKAFDGRRVYPARVLKDVAVEFGNIKKNLSLYVITGVNHPLLGREWLVALQQWPIQFKKIKESDECNHIQEGVEEGKFSKICDNYRAVFTPGVGLFKKGTLDLKVKPGSIPKCLKARPIPLALKPLVENEIKRLLKSNILKPVEYSQWTTPIVPVLKGDGSVRVCGDFKLTLYPVLEIDHFPMPRMEQLFAALQGCTVFSKIVLKDAYQQVPLTEQAQGLVVIITHLGLFKYTRLPYGVSTGPGSFQRILS
ncbi:uncharacterized protein [Venturia canescens]|uniref:uncharacterized protein n=1 Tax=Venturia canescens TaxID=32260 RepID=UPI001C9D3AAA|nr:uncharacterized protein LOC122416728 [Venturia canescens]